MNALIHQTPGEDLNACISPQPALTGDILPQENAIVPSQTKNVESLKAELEFTA